VDHAGDAMNHAAKPLLTGWRYLLWRVAIGGEGKGYHKDASRRARAAAVKIRYRSSSVAARFSWAQA
jgi:hypothetical protein